jgi:uncharacterized protein YbaP (TraB family)
MFKPLKRTLAATAFALAFSAAPAFAEAPPAATPAVEMKPGAPAIWTIAKPGGGSITLFGSVHLLPANQQWRTPAFTEALAKADVVVFETPIAGMQTPELQQYLAANMMNPPGVTLSTLLSPEEKATVEKAATSIGAPFSALEGFRPWIVSLQLGIGLIMKQGFDPNSGVDKTVEAEATAAGKTLDYFETAKEQLDIFVTMPPEQERNMLVVGAQEIIDNPNSISEMVTAWAAADTASLDKLLNEGLESDPALGKKLLEDRNANWVAKITGPYMADAKNYLIVVGAGHLAGDKGVPAMLRAKGIEVAGP